LSEAFGGRVGDRLGRSGAGGASPLVGRTGRAGRTPHHQPGEGPAHETGEEQGHQTGEEKGHPRGVTTTGSSTIEQVRRWCVTAAQAADAKMGAGTIILEVGRVLAITDAFVITSGTNARQVRSIAEEVERRLKVADDAVSPLRTEGLDDAGWVLLDYGDFVVHVFLDEVRRFYDLERLWADAPRWAWEPERAASG